jgi:hypothetical protein
MAAFAVGQIYAHIVAIRRFAVGVHGPLNWLTASGWDPPVPFWALFFGFGTAIAATAVWLVRAASPDPSPA